MKKIVVQGIGFSDEQKARLEKLGELKYFADTDSSEEFLEQVEGADVICCWGDYVLENVDKLSDVLITYPYIEFGNFDSAKLAERNIKIANTRGSNKYSIAEWTMYMVIALFREFPSMTNVTEDLDFKMTESLEDKKVLVVGKGDIGTQVGELCKAFQMDVDYFERGDNLDEKAATADLVINCLNCNSTSKNLLNEEFFMGMKKGSKYITFVRPFTYDIDGLIKALDAGVVSAAAIDCDPEEPGDTKNAFYQKALAHDKVLVTPHVAFATKRASENGREFAIQNIEAYLSGSPQNLVVKN